MLLGRYYNQSTYRYITHLLVYLNTIKCVFLFTRPNIDKISNYYEKVYYSQFINSSPTQSTLMSTPLTWPLPHYDHFQKVPTTFLFVLMWNSPSNATIHLHWSGVWGWGGGGYCTDPWGEYHSTPYLFYSNYVWTSPQILYPYHGGQINGIAPFSPQIELKTLKTTKNNIGYPHHEWPRKMMRMYL